MNRKHGAKEKQTMIKYGLMQSQMDGHKPQLYNVRK